MWHEDVEQLEYEKEQRKMSILTASIVSDFNSFFHMYTIFTACRLSGLKARLGTLSALQINVLLSLIFVVN